MITKVLKDSSVYGLMGVFSAFTATIITPIYTRLFTSAEYATLDFLITTLAILAILCGTWIDTGVARNYYLAKEKGEGLQLVSTGLVLCIISSAIFMMLIGGAYVFFLQGYANTTISMLVPLLIVLLPRRIQAYSMQILRLDHRPKPFLFIAIGQLSTTVLFSIYGGLTIGIVGILWAFVISRTLFAIVGLIMLRSHIGFHWSGDEARDLFLFGIPLIPTYLNQWIPNYTGRIILIAAVTLTQVGHFSLALRIAALSSIFRYAFNQAWIPYYNEMLDHSDSDAKYARMLNFYLMGMLAIAILTGSFSPILVNIFGTADYLSAVSVITFVSMGFFWDGSLKIIDAGISKVRKTIWTSIAVISGWLIYLGLMLLYAPQYGTLAAGISYLAATSSAALIVLYISQKFHPMPYNMRFIGAILIASWGIGFLNLWILPQSEIEWLQLFYRVSLSLLSSLIIWCGLIWIFFPSEDIQPIKKMALRYLPIWSRRS